MRILKKSEMKNHGTITRKQNKVKKYYEKFNKLKKQREELPVKIVIRKKETC